MSIQRSEYEKYFIPCSYGSVTTCSLRRKHRHCKLCCRAFDTPFHCKRHFLQSHASRAVPYHGNLIYPCKMKHSEIGTSPRAHFHCPACTKTISHRHDFVKHLKKHLSPLQRPEEKSPQSGTTNQGNDEHVREASGVQQEVGHETQNEAEPEGLEQGPVGEDATVDEERQGIKDDDRNEGTPEKAECMRGENSKKSCSVCGKEMHPKSLARHCRVAHGVETASMATCVDEQDGLFLVRNSSHGGVGYPIHVKKVMGSEHGVQCEVRDCMDFMRVAWKSGMKTAMCKHLEKVGTNCTFPEEIELSTEALNDLSPSGAFKMFKNDRIQECITLKTCAAKDNSRCVVSVQESTRFHHFSVYDGNVHYYSRFRRVVVTADMAMGTLDCRCCRRKRMCIHKCICLWYFRQQNLLDNFRATATESGEEIDVDSEEEEQPTLLEAAPKSSGVAYPPEDNVILLAMCKYLHQEKRIPMTDDDSIIPNPVSCMKFIPVETTCVICCTPLSVPKKITDKAVTLTLNYLVEGVETFYKRCAECGMCYRYQEIDCYIHNFNDSFLIGLDVCRFLRDSLQQHLPIGSVVKVLEGRLKRRLNPQTVVNAYLHFDALSDHSYDYNCLLCGYHPTTLIMDLNKKVSFACNMSDMELPEAYNRDDADFVHCDKFWENVELSMIQRGFPGRNLPELDVTPSLLSWSPFIGRLTRKSPLLLNTEHRKVDRRSGELETDCREITEERLLELLHNSSLKEVLSFAKSLGLKPNGAKLDIILQVKNAISKDEAKFQKAFTKMWGCSGGWVSGTCPHGVIYTLKFVLRAESPRDYVDLLLSMAHQPNIIINDMANMLVTHGNKRKKDMFYPFNGMVAEPTQSNIQKSLDGKLEISLPWLDSGKEGNPAPQSFEVHPVSGSDQHLCLFDRLHERNVKKEEETLRRVTNVKELKGKLNTQKDEQLHASYNHDSRYLNQMKPINHIFLFRSNIDVHNEKINERLKKGLTSAFNYQISRDKNGQAVIDKTNPSKLKFTKGEDGAPIPGLRKEPRKGEARTSTDPESHSSDKNSSSDTCNYESSLPGINLAPDEKAADEPSTSTSKRSKHLQYFIQTTGNPDAYWIEVLGLKISDKHLLEDGYWLNDRLINAAMSLLRNETYEKNIGGLQDVVIAEDQGFHCSDSGDGFVQIVNVRGNHWVTVSNMLHKDPITCIYDSFQALNVKTKDKKISYPIKVEQAACGISRRSKSFTMVVENVQQQNRGEDCGLFAIAYAALLCMNNDPVKANISQGIMRLELVESFENMDIKRFVRNVTTMDNSKKPEVLYTWTCKVYCICRMPDDGRKMVKCTKCKSWYHCECVIDYLSSQDWRCPNCEAPKKNAPAGKATTYHNGDVASEEPISNTVKQGNPSNRRDAESTANQQNGNSLKPKKPKSEKSDLNVNEGTFNSRGCRGNPIDVSTVEERPSPAEDVVWIAELHLTVKERNILLNKSWLNDSIINAAMVLIRKDCCRSEVGGLEDVVIGRDRGFSRSDRGQGFIQIINVGNNHWVTLSNILWEPPCTSVYDSFQALRVKGMEGGMRYPIVVDQVACQISKHEKSLTMLVENVQQQDRTEDCGLFAIAFAAMLAFNQDPLQAVINQSVMRRELLQSFEEMNMKRFVTNVVTVDEKKKAKVVHRWTRELHCICRMPDDGSNMVVCCKCQERYHEECSQSDCRKEDWFCGDCDYARRQDAAERRRFAAAREKVNLEVYREKTKKYARESERVQHIYAAIAATYTSFKFKDAASHIGCMNKDDWLEVEEIERCNDFLGVALSSGTGDDFDHFVVIFPGAFDSDQRLLSTVIHEMAHVLDSASATTFHPAHGPKFKKAGRSLIRHLKENPSTLPIPYRGIKLDEVLILTKSKETSPRVQKQPDVEEESNELKKDKRKKNREKKQVKKMRKQKERKMGQDEMENDEEDN